jgi:aryl-alcohol dehydrogenase-like predicted oxidoreductase
MYVDSYIVDPGEAATMNAVTPQAPDVRPVLGLGVMGMSDLYGPADDTESVSTIQAALDAGIRLLETGDAYGAGHGELLLREALRGRRDEAVISLRFGPRRAPDGSWAGPDNRPASVKNALAHSLTRLGTDYVDIYRPSLLDPDVPIEETIGALADLVQAGYVRRIGLSEVGAETLRRAHAVHPISDLQIEYSLFSRGIEDTILPAARELGISVTAYGTLSRGLLTGSWSTARQQGLSVNDFRNGLPRFQGEHLNHQLALVENLREVAQAKGVTVAQLAIAWVSAQGADIVPLVGARRREQLADVLGAAGVSLDAGELAAIEKAVPVGAVRGERYPPALMSRLDSERVTDR